MAVTLNKLMSVAESRDVSDDEARGTRAWPAPGDGSSLSTAALKYVFGSSLAGLAFMATYSSAAVEFPAAELRDILMLGAAIHTVPFVAALVLLRSKVRNAVLALVVLGSLWTAYLVHTDLYLTGSRAVFWLCALAIGGGSSQYSSSSTRIAGCDWLCPRLQHWPWRSG